MGKSLLFTSSSRFPKPDWEAIARQIEIAECDPDAAWRSVATEWMEVFAAALGQDYRIHHSGDLLLVTRAPNRRACEILEYIVQCEKEILNELPFIDPSTLIGILPVIIFGDEINFYEYLSMYYGQDVGNKDQEEEYGAAGGVFLGGGYGHIAMPSENLDYYRQTLCHEMCHATLASLALPLWLDEAVTAEVEHHLTGGNPYFLDRDMVKEHKAYWNDERLEAFWSGMSFYSPDEGQTLSYHLARYLFHAIAPLSNPETIGNFMHTANDGNYGRSAARQCFGIDLNEVIDGLVGVGR